MNPALRIDPALQWHRFRNVEGGKPLLYLRGERAAYDVDVSAALSAFFRAQDLPALKRFLRDYGPLVEPAGREVEATTLSRERAAFAQIWRSWRDMDGKT